MVYTLKDPVPSTLQVKVVKLVVAVPSLAHLTLASQILELPPEHDVPHHYTYMLRLFGWLVQ